MAEYLDVSAKVEFSKAKEIAARVAELYSSGEVDAVYAIYNEFKNVMVQNLRAEKLLPVDPEVVRKSPDGEELAAHHAGPGGALPTEPAPGGQGRLVDYIYEQPAAEIFNKLVPRYVEMQIYRMLAESSAAEHAARMTAMESATSNAADVIDALTLHMNKVRQAAITREIIEVVSGAASAG
jgi:F-type H+-transporting ATPase subunit gamma